MFSNIRRLQFFYLKIFSPFTCVRACTFKLFFLFSFIYKLAFPTRSQWQQVMRVGFAVRQRPYGTFYACVRLFISEKGGFLNSAQPRLMGSRSLSIRSQVPGLLLYQPTRSDRHSVASYEGLNCRKSYSTTYFVTITQLERLVTAR